MDDGYHGELKNIHKKLMDGNFLQAANSLCRKTKQVAAGRAGFFQIIREDCCDNSTKNASCNETCHPDGFCCSLSDKISDRNCPAGINSVLSSVKSLLKCFSVNSIIVFIMHVQNLWS